MADQHQRFDVVSFLSDYGRVDESVGVIEAVIRDLAPHATTLHLTHDVAPFDVRAGSLALARAIAYVPAGVVLAIVDPRYAARRRPVAIEVGGGVGVIVGPDNGLLAPAVALAGGADRAVHLDNALFHLSDGPTMFRGRDVYAPVVAALLNGADLNDVGTPVDPGELLPGTIPLPRHEDDTVIGEVLGVDRFGNVQLNIGPDEVPASWGPRLQARLSASGVHGADDTVRTLHRSDPPPQDPHPDEPAPDARAGAIMIFPDAHGLLTLAMADRSAAGELDVVAGDRLVLAEISGPSEAASTRVELGRRPNPEP